MATIVFMAAVFTAALLGGSWVYRGAAKDTYRFTGWCIVCRRGREHRPVDAARDPEGGDERSTQGS